MLFPIAEYGKYAKTRRTAIRKSQIRPTISLQNYAIEEEEPNRPAVLRLPGPICNNAGDPYSKAMEIGFVGPAAGDPRLKLCGLPNRRQVFDSLD